MKYERMYGTSSGIRESSHLVEEVEFEEAGVEFDDCSYN